MVGRNLGVSCSDCKSRPTSFDSCSIVAILAKDPIGHIFLGLGRSRSIKAIAISSSERTAERSSLSWDGEPHKPHRDA